MHAQRFQAFNQLQIEFTTFIFLSANFYDAIYKSVEPCYVKPYDTGEKGYDYSGIMTV